MSTLTPRQRFAAALDRRPLPGRVPHFELVFFLTMEAFGKVHPSHRSYHQWLQMSEPEKRAHRLDMARLYIDTAERFEHDAIFLHPNPDTLEETLRLLDAVRELSGDRFFILLHGDATHHIPDGEHMEDFALKMAEQPDEFERDSWARVDYMLRRGETIAKHGGADGFALCCDYCFNTGPFMNLDQFDRFIAPQLARLVAGYRAMGFYTIKHTDGNIMPILDRLLAAKPHALHSLDPQGGVDMAEMVRRAGDHVCLCGNVNCGALQTGTDEECIASARYAIHHGLQAPGYVFCTSNCIYTGMTLDRYELIRNVWKQEAIRP